MDGLSTFRYTATDREVIWGEITALLARLPSQAVQADLVERYGICHSSARAWISKSRIWALARSTLNAQQASNEFRDILLSALQDPACTVADRRKAAKLYASVFGLGMMPAPSLFGLSGDADVEAAADEVEVQPCSPPS